MSYTTLSLLVVIEAIFYFNSEAITRVFTTDEAVAQKTISCIFIICIGFIPDMIQGSIQGVIRALDVQQKASCYALIAFYLAAIPLAVILVFIVGMDVKGLWLAMILGITIQAITYTRLVLVTDWQ